MSPRGPIEVGSRFENLEIQAEIGAGGFGVVYRAWDVSIRRFVALKVVRDFDAGSGPADARKKFLDEAHALGRIGHPNVATLYHVYTLEGGDWVLALEYVEGASLDAILEGGKRLPVEEAVALARDLAAGLRAAHLAGVVHGDVKPANVIRRKDGVVKLVDFGLARRLESVSRRSSASNLAGTPHYMAPEVIDGELHVPASDVWGLGAVLYRALSGRLPFDAPSIVPLFYAIGQAEPAPLPEDLPVALRRLVMACLAKRPEDRPALDDRFFEALDLRRRATATPVEEAKPVVRPTPPLVGREAECQRIAAAIDRVASGKTGLLAITGPAGIGKSRLSGFADAAARARGFRVVTATASTGEGIVRPLHRALASESRGSAGASRAGSESNPSVGRGRAAGPVEVERRLAALAGSHPVLVLVEDLHRASVEDVRALGRLAARLEGSPVLFLVTERVPDLDASSNAAPRVEPLLVEGRERLDVGALSRDALHAILERTSGDERIGANVLERAVQRSGGNPLFALEILAYERSTAATAAAAGRPSTRTSSTIPAPPPALRDALARRLRGLPEPLREVLDVAAVDGLEFDAEALAEVLRIPALDVLRRLQRLARAHGLVVAREHGHRFAHPLMQEVVYAEVAPELRRALHRRLAEHLEKRAETVDPERLGTHWERAEEPGKAMPWLLEAAHRAAMRLENWRCVDLAMRAGIVPGKTPVDLVLAHTNQVFEIASAASDLGRQADRDALYEDVARTIAGSRDEFLGLRLAARKGLTRFLGAGLQDGDEAALRHAAEALPDCVERGIAAYALGLVEKYRGHLADAEAWFRRADGFFLSHGALGRHGSVLDQLASIALRSGATREAAASYREAARVCREGGQAANAEISEVNAVLAEIELGELDGAVERLDRAARQLDAEGMVAPATRVRVVLAHVQAAAGDVAIARRTADRALRQAQTIGSSIATREAHAIAADLAALSGDASAAAEHLRAALSLCAPGKSVRERATLLALAASHEAIAGHFEQANALASESVELAESLGEPRTILDVAGWLVDSTAFGMDPRAARMAIASAERSGSVTGHALDGHRSVLSGSAAARDRDYNRLRIAADDVRRSDCGLRRALRRAFADVWLALAEQLASGKPTSVRDILAEATARARDSGLTVMGVLAERLLRVEERPESGGP